MHGLEHAAGDAAEADAHEGTAEQPDTSVQLCYPNGTKGLGDPVRIQITSGFDLLPILGVGSLSLKAKATMRLEHTQEALSERWPPHGRRAMFVRLRATDFRRESGQVVVLFAILLPVLFGLGAIVLDIGNWYVHKRHLQTQVDAAALAAATGFRACFFDAASANLGIASVALSYAGDTARDPDARNQQVQVPGAMRVTLNSQRYWADGRFQHADVERIWDSDGSSRRRQCRHSVRDQHARREGD